MEEFINRVEEHIKKGGDDIKIHCNEYDNQHTEYIAWLLKHSNTIVGWSYGPDEKNPEECGLSFIEKSKEDKENNTIHHISLNWNPKCYEESFKKKEKFMEDLVSNAGMNIDFIEEVIVIIPSLMEDKQCFDTDKLVNTLKNRYGNDYVNTHTLKMGPMESYKKITIVKIP